MKKVTIYFNSNLASWVVDVETNEDAFRYYCHSFDGCLDTARLARDNHFSKDQEKSLPYILKVLIND